MDVSYNFAFVMRQNLECKGADAMPGVGLIGETQLVVLHKANLISNAFDEDRAIDALVRNRQD